MAEVDAPPRVITVGAEIEPEVLVAYLGKRRETRTALVSHAHGDILVVKDVWGRPFEKYRLVKLGVSVRWQRVA